MNFLTPMEKLYGLGMTVRNRLYDRGVLRSYSLGAFTVAIGNLTTGGTGKTPLAALTARVLAENGEKVCILTRGYGRTDPGRRVLVSDGGKVLADAFTGGDEPVELARKLIGKAIVVADADRVGAARWAIDRFGITAFVLDDAYQHRRAQRDVNIACIDATMPFEDDRVLPAGRLREPLSGLRRADIVVVTRTDLVDSPARVIADLEKINPNAAVFTATTQISSVTALNDLISGGETETTPPDRSPFLFCGIGNPDNFRKQLETAGYDPAGSRAFADHHRYMQSDIDSLEKEARELKAGYLLTTVKDAVKLEGLKFAMPVFAVEMEMILNDPGRFESLILRNRRGK